MTQVTHSDRTIVLQTTDGDTDIFHIKNVADFIPNEMLIDMIAGPPDSQIGRAM